MVNKWRTKARNLVERTNNNKNEAMNDMAVVVFSFLPVEKTMLKNVLNPVIAKMSSKLLAAISKVGMPFSIPYPFSCKNSMEGTTTAGETAPSTKLRERLWKPMLKHPFNKTVFYIEIYNKYINLYNNFKYKNSAVEWMLFKGGKISLSHSPWELPFYFVTMILTILDISLESYSFCPDLFHSA